MRTIRRGAWVTVLGSIVLAAVLAALSGALVPATRAAGNGVILLDGTAAEGNTVISPGEHMISAQAEGEHIYIAVYENKRLLAVSLDGTLTCSFADSGMEIGLYCLDSEFRPLGEAVRVVQVQDTPSQTLVYSGEAECVDEYNIFDDYTVRLKVVTKDGVITEIRDIAGYTASGEATNSANAGFLSLAATGIVERIIEKQSTDGVDAVSGATFASHAILNAVKAALNSEPEIETEPDPGGGDDTSVPDGVYTGSAQCQTRYMNYMVDVDVTVQDGVITEIADKTLKTPMSTKDRTLYTQAWEGLSDKIAGANREAASFRAVDAVSGATISSMSIQSAVENALKTQTAAQTVTGTLYAPEGISLYALAYPVVTVEGGKMTEIRIVPASGTDMASLEAFAGEILERQSVTGLSWSAGIEDDAFTLANLIDQILYGEGVLK